MKRRDTVQAVEAEIGFACGDDGRGVAYARVRRAASEQLLRVAFRLSPGFGDREIAYAAVTAVARTLQRRGVRKARLAVDDPSLVADIAARLDLPAAMVLPYVRLKCALNGFDDVKITPDGSCELAQRARAEVALHSAA